MDSESIVKKRFLGIVEQLRRPSSTFGWLAVSEPESPPSTLEQNNARVNVTSSVRTGSSTERCSSATPKLLEVPLSNNNHTANLVSHGDGATIRPVGRDDAAEPVELPLGSSPGEEHLPPRINKVHPDKDNRSGPAAGWSSQDSFFSTSRAHPCMSCSPDEGHLPKLVASDEVDATCNCLSLPPNTLVPSQQADVTVSSVALSDLPPSLTPPTTTSSSSNDPRWSSLKGKFPKGNPWSAVRKSSTADPPTGWPQTVRSGPTNHSTTSLHSTTNIILNHIEVLTKQLQHNTSEFNKAIRFVKQYNWHKHFRLVGQLDDSFILEDSVIASLEDPLIKLLISHQQMREQRITLAIELHMNAIKHESAVNSLANLVNYLEHKLPNLSPTIADSDETSNPPHTTSTHPVHRSNNRKSKKNRVPHSSHDANTCTSPDCLTCAGENVINLSNTPLDQSQVTLLSKGLSFIPASADLETKEITHSLNQFITELRLKYADIKTVDRASNVQHDWPSTRLLPNQLENTILAMRNDMAALTDSQTSEEKKISKHNLTRRERFALRRLSKNRQLVYNKADKSTQIVVRHRKDYIRQGLEHLSDPNTYTKLDRDYTLDVSEYIKTQLGHYRRGGLLSAQMIKKCTPCAEPRTARLYFLTKTHKPDLSIRPIVSSVNSATENLSSFVEGYLHNIMVRSASYLKDTTQFIREITNIDIQQTDILVTIDVKSLYTSIPNKDGLQACYEAWRDEEIRDPQHPPAETLRHLLEIVLKLNTLEFNKEFYLQTQGSAMGAVLAPAYANVFMTKLESEVINLSEHKPVYYRRYIDDIFLLWREGEMELHRFIHRLNSANSSIKFTHEHSQEEVTFLDVKVYRDSRTPEKLQVKTHIKPTSRQLYVRMDSHHPPGATKGVATGEAIRYLRTNTDKKNFHKMMLLHKRNLTKRGYPRSMINQTLRRIKFSMRPSVMDPNYKGKSKLKRSDDNTQPLNYKTRYGSQASKAFRLINKHWSSLQRASIHNKKLIKFVRGFEPRLSYKSNQNLARHLVRAKLKNDTSQQSSSGDGSCHQPDTAEGQRYIANLAGITHNQDIGLKINTTRCKNDSKCPLHGRLICTNQIRSKISGRAFITRGKSNCNTQRVVYAIQCRKCKKQYVGQTCKSLKQRFTRHLQIFKQPFVASTLHEHFNRGGCRGLDNISIQVLQTVSSGITDQQAEAQLKQYETLWINRLMCEYPQGLNYVQHDPRIRYSSRRQ